MGFIADIFGGNQALKAQERAANRSIDATQAATRDSLALQREMFDKIWSGTQIGRDAGNAATERLAAISGLGGGTGELNWDSYLTTNPDVKEAIAAGQFGGTGGIAGAAQRHYAEYGQREGRAAPNAMTTTDWLRSTPGYDVNFNEGARALNTRLAGQGRLQSGDAQREAVQYGQDYANRIFGQERNALQALAGLGQSATATGAGSASNTAGLGTNTMLQNARNLSSSYGQIGDAQSGFWGNMVGLFGSGGSAQMAGNFMRGFM